ncbi:MAG: leucine-rich repeat protein [Clostridia bacterium]|nr:leucine-rich repeat protein [Clostridia bacterium]
MYRHKVNRFVGFIVFILIFSIFVSGQVVSVGADTEEIKVLDSGQCGDTLNWELTSDGVLRIFGEGAMYDYNKYYEPSPWYKYRDEPYVSADGKNFIDSNGDTYVSTEGYHKNNPMGYKVKSIVIEEGITYIGDWAFYRVCVDEITVPEGVEATGIFCFRYSPTLKVLNLPDSLKILDDFAISRNYLLHTVNIGSQLEKVGTAGFNRNPSLKSIILPDSCVSVNQQMSPTYADIDYSSVGLMENCTSLKTVKLGKVDRIPQRTFLGADIENLIVPNTVKSIDEYAFYKCDSLRNVVFEENSLCTFIANNAFLECTSLKSVTGGISLETMGSYSKIKTLEEFDFSDSNKTLLKNQFYQTSLKTVRVSENITTIPVSCFNRMSYLERIYLPSSLETIQGSSFNYCVSLTDVYYNGNLQQWQAIEKASGWSYMVNSDCVVHLNDGTFANLQGKEIPKEKLSFTVEFRDFDSSVLSTQDVKYGSSAVAPENPYRDDYIFDGWDKDFSNITDDLVVTAKYKEKAKYTVTYNEGNFTFSGADTVKQGEDYTFRIMPFAGYDVEKIVAGKDEPEINKNGIYTIKNVNEDIFIEVTLVQDNEEYDFAGASITLGGDIELNFYMELSDEIIKDEDSKLVFTLPNGRKESIPAEKAEKIDGYYVFSCSVAAKEMASAVKAQLIASDFSSEGFEYSIKEYAEYILNSKDEKYDSAKPLVKAMLNYGAYAQIYFDYDSENLANETLKKEEKELKEIDLSAFVYSLNGEEAGVEYYGSKLSLESETSVKHYFSIEAEVDFSEITVNGKTVTAEKKDKYYEVKIPDIPAHKLDEKLVVKVGDLTLDYNALSYAQLVLSGNDTNLKNLMKALCAYNIAADEYIG